MKPNLALPLPGSGQQIRALQRERKALAVESAGRSRFWRPRLTHIDTSKLDEPEEWRKIPILDKEMLRSLSNDQFYNDFCIPAPGKIAEHWRSGGTTGRPLFYLRTFEDIRYAMVGFARSFMAMNVQPGETAHLSLPLGIHPAGHMWARAGEMMGIGMNWVGSGAAAPSELQLELIATLKPSLWIGMPSYGLHLANLAGARGQNLRDGSVQKILCTAEPLSRAKREKLERAWGAEVYDAFGMTEVSMMGAEGEAGDGLHMWADLAFIEVVDPATSEPVPAGEPGLLVVTSLFTNNTTPFLRWCSGDIVAYREQRHGEDPLSVFPLLRHAHRTAGFFKIRGVNINHSELEDLMFADSDSRPETVARLLSALPRRAARLVVVSISASFLRTMKTASPPTAEDVKELALELGADLVGVASAKTLNAFPPDPKYPQTPERVSPYCKSVIVVVQRIPVGAFRCKSNVPVQYLDMLVLRKMDKVAYRLAEHLERAGYPSFVTAAQETDWNYKRASYGRLSTRHLGIEAGLGTFGLEVNILTPEYGPRVYLTGILTELELEPDAPMTEQVCIGESCSRCLYSCPTDAIGHFDIDKRDCAKEAQEFGFTTILKYFERFVASSRETKAGMLKSRDLYGFWQGLLRVVGSFGDCPRCLAVCPVGDDYYAHLVEIQKFIPETTDEKITKAKGFKAARKRGDAIEGLNEWNARWVGPEGYQGLVARHLKKFREKQKALLARSAKR